MLHALRRGLHALAARRAAGHGARHHLQTNDHKTLSHESYNETVNSTHQSTLFRSFNLDNVINVIDSEIGRLLKHVLMGILHVVLIRYLVGHCNSVPMLQMF